ncbi:MAG TPA: hypothetical protein VK913_12290, partial [Erythrobacter sp.]|nr:hypothetical protein [Erythrobacter sp.]
MPILSLLASSPPLLNAVLSVAAPLPPPDPAVALRPVSAVWSLAPQDAGAQGSPPGEGPSDGEEGN